MPLVLAPLPPAALLQVFGEMSLRHLSPVAMPRSRCREQRAGDGPISCPRASSLAPWREDEEEWVRKLGTDGVDESCFLSTH